MKLLALAASVISVSVLVSAQSTEPMPLAHPVRGNSLRVELPGFTSISMYPKLMAHAGVDQRELVTALCELALAHHRVRRGLSNLRG